MSRESVGAPLLSSLIVMQPKVASPGTILLTEDLHAGRIVLIDVVHTGAGPTFKLPQATGTGNKYTIVNNAIQSGTSIIVSTFKIDIMNGVSVSLPQVGSTEGEVFYAVSGGTINTITWNATTTGGLKGDMIEALDMRQDAAGTGVWLVRVASFVSGTTATPFS